MPKKTTKDLNLFCEWAVWGHLDSETNLELIVLKGHLLLEIVLDSVLLSFDLKNPKDYSFHRKIVFFEKLNITETKKQILISNCLRDINKMRNKLAHEFEFDVNNDNLERWSVKIHDNLNGRKWTKYTRRTKIIHSFSILSLNLLDLRTN